MYLVGKCAGLKIFYWLLSSVIDHNALRPDCLGGFS